MTLGSSLHTSLACTHWYEVKPSKIYKLQREKDAFLEKPTQNVISCTLGVGSGLNTLDFCTLVLNEQTSEGEDSYCFTTVELTIFKQQITADLDFKCCSETVELKDVCAVICLNFRKSRKYNHLNREAFISFFPLFYFSHQLLHLRLLSSQKTEKSVQVNQWNCLPKW